MFNLEISYLEKQQMKDFLEYLFNLKIKFKMIYLIMNQIKSIVLICLKVNIKNFKITWIPDLKLNKSTVQLNKVRERVLIINNFFMKVLELIQKITEKIVKKKVPIIETQFKINSNKKSKVHMVVNLCKKVINQCN